LILPLSFIALVATAVGCSADADDDTVSPSTSSSSSSSGSSSDSSGNPTTGDPATTVSPDSSGGEQCEGRIIDAAPVPEGWEGPVAAYGFDGNVSQAPDCGDGTTASVIGAIDSDTTVCACECSAPADDLCAVSMFSNCEGAGIGGYTGGCQPFDQQLAQFRANVTPLGSCVAAPVADVPPNTPSVFGCEIPSDGCVFVPETERVCIWAQGMADSCPSGFENGPFFTGDVVCEGECDNCLTPEYCSGLTLELHSTADCSGLAVATVSGQQCPGGAFAAVQAVAEPLRCAPPGELTRTPLAVSVCCQP